MRASKRSPIKNDKFRVFDAESSSSCLLSTFVNNFELLLADVLVDANFRQSFLIFGERDFKLSKYTLFREPYLLDTLRKFTGFHSSYNNVPGSKVANEKKVKRKKDTVSLNLLKYFKPPGSRQQGAEFMSS